MELADGLVVDSEVLTDPRTDFLDVPDSKAWRGVELETRFLPPLPKVHVGVNPTISPV